MTKKKKGKSAPAKRRSAEALAAWRLGHKVKPSAKLYKRRPKNQKPRGAPPGAFDLPARVA